MISTKTFRKSSILFLLLWLGLAECKAQQHTLDSLNTLDGTKTKTYYSNGAKENALTMATRCDNVLAYYKSQLNFQPNVKLLVLSPEDWSTYTSFPVYGMPHLSDNETLVVASQDNDFWKSFIPPLDQLPPTLAKQITDTYKGKDGQLSMRGFFDLLAIHELGHAYHNQAGLKMQRKWMGELFPNILLHTYIAENEPEILPALTLFPQMVVASTSKNDLKFTTLHELETNYYALGKQFPKNYGWYQCRWHMAAATIYDEGGIKALKNLWDALESHQDLLDDSSFVALLADSVHQSIANVPLKWDD